MDSQETPIIFCDAVQSLGVHNSVVRIALIRLAADGTPAPSGELMVPASQLPTLIAALQQVRA